MDQARKAFRQRVVAETPLFHRSRLEVLDQDVGAFQQAQQHRLTLRLADVERDRALVAVDADEIAGVTFVERRAPVAHLVTLRRLDLDHVGAMIGQDHRAVRTAEDAGQVDDLQAGQRAGRFRQPLALGRRRVCCVVHAAVRSLVSRDNSARRAGTRQIIGPASGLPPPDTGCRRSAHARCGRVAAHGARRRHADPGGRRRPTPR